MNYLPAFPLYIVCMYQATWENFVLQSRGWWHRKQTYKTLPIIRHLKWVLITEEVLKFKVPVQDLLHLVFRQDITGLDPGAKGIFSLRLKKAASESWRKPCSLIFSPSICPNTLTYHFAQHFIQSFTKFQPQTHFSNLPIIYPNRYKKVYNIAHKYPLDPTWPLTPIDHSSTQHDPTWDNPTPLGPIAMSLLPFNL